MVIRIAFERLTINSKIVNVNITYSICASVAYVRT